MGIVAGTERTPKVLDGAAAEAARKRGLDHHGQIPRKTIWLAAFVMIGLTAIGVIGVAAIAPGDSGGPRRDTKGQLAEDGGDKPHIIERPNSGTAPKDNGDRGGWEQLALFGVLTVAIGGITYMMVRSRGRAETGRKAWAAAAASGHDGAVGEIAGSVIDRADQATRDADMVGHPPG